MHEVKSVLFVLIGASSYGILSTLVKLAYRNGFGPGEVTGSQMFFGVLLLALLLWVLRKGEPMRLRQWLLLIAAGMTTGLTGIFYYSALQYVPASIGIILLFQFTWMGVLLEWIIDRKKPSREKIVSVVLLVVGTLLSGNLLAPGFTSIPIVGIILGLLSAASYAGFILASGRLAPRSNPWMRSMIFSLGSLTITWLVFPPAFLFNGSLMSGLMFWGILLAFFGIVVPNLLFMYAIPKVGTGLATILGAVELPMAVFMSWSVLKENVSMIQWIGVILILLGIVVAELRLTKGKGQWQTGT